MKKARAVSALAAMLLLAGAAMADVVIETVPVGNAGNADDTEGDGYGSVSYTYNIGKTEVSNAQYAELLNAVATVGDPHGLYNANMGSGWNDIGGISRTGSGTGGDPWLYAVRTNRGDRPVNYVSFWDACRFANWLHNGQPTGGQDLTTTEDGAYFLNGVTNPANNTITREADWNWAVTSEDEWYKAAYYDGAGGAYYDYPTGSNTEPTDEAPPGTDMANGSANYDTVDFTYRTTVCGAYTAKPSDSPYGTYDQGGNVLEWNDAIVWTASRGARGGTFEKSHTDLRASERGIYDPTIEMYYMGFRVSKVSPIPEPAGLGLAGLALLAICRRRS